MAEPQTLYGAILTWGNPVAVAEMIRLETEGWDAPLSFVGGRETESDRQSARYRSIRGQLESALIEDLRQGKLIASGYDSRAGIDVPALIILADRWRVLTPNFKDSSATTGGIIITGILVRESDAARASAKESVTANSGQQMVRFRIKHSQRLVFIDDKEYLIPDKPFELLWILAEQAVRDSGFVSKQTIEDRLWDDPDHEVFRPSRDVVRDLRRVLAAAGSKGTDKSRQLIEQRTGHGYRLRLAAEEITLET